MCKKKKETKLPYISFQHKRGTCHYDEIQLTLYFMHHRFDMNVNPEIK